MNPLKARRGHFLKNSVQTGAAAWLSAAAYRDVLGANERLRVGFIGVGLIGKRHLLDFMAQPDVEIPAISDL